MILGLLQLAVFLGTAWLIGHLVELCYDRTDGPGPSGGTAPPPPPAPSPTPATRVPELAGRR